MPEAFNWEFVFVNNSARPGLWLDFSATGTMLKESANRNKSAELKIVASKRKK